MADRPTLSWCHDMLIGVPPAAFLVRPPSVEEDMDPKAAEKLQQAAATAAADALKEALTKVSADDVSAAQPHIDTAFDWFHQAVEQAKQVDEKKKQEKEDKEKEEKDKAAANSAAQPNGAAAKVRWNGWSSHCPYQTAVYQPPEW